MSPYSGQIGNIRAGLMGTPMPESYGVPGQQPGGPNPLAAPQTPGFHLQSPSADQYHVSSGASGMQDMYEIARKGNNHVGYTSVADDVQMANSGQGGWGKGR